MPEDTLASPAVDPATLADVVRQDQRSPSFTLDTWAVSPISHHTIIDTTGGLFRLHGRGHDVHGERAWSVALKIVRDPGGETVRRPRNWAFWERELRAYQSGLLGGIPQALAAPRCYDVQPVEGGAWLWLEHVVESAPRRWSLDEYALVARRLGQFAGAYLVGRPLPDATWLTDGFYRSIYAPDDFWTAHLDPAAPGNAWESAVTQAWYPAARRERTLALLADRERFLTALDRLPQVFCHHDAHRRNLLIRGSPGGEREVVAIDWAFCGRGAPGADLSALVITSLFNFEHDPATPGALEARAYAAYLDGLREAGWAGDERIVRLGYLASVALGFSISMPGWTGHLLGEAQVAETTRQFGCSADEIAAGWLTLWEHAHECAAEARPLIAAFGIS